MDGLSKAGLRDLIVDAGGIKAKDVGRIDLKNTFSFFDVEPALAQKVYKSFYRKEYNGRNIRLQAADGDSASQGGSRGKFPRKDRFGK